MGDNCTKRILVPLIIQKRPSAPTIEGTCPNFVHLTSPHRGPPDLLESGQLTFDFIGLLLGNILTFKKRSGPELQVKSLCITHFHLELSRYKCKENIHVYYNIEICRRLLSSFSVRSTGLLLVPQTSLLNRSNCPLSAPYVIAELRIIALFPREIAVKFPRACSLSPYSKKGDESRRREKRKRLHSR